MFKRYWIGSPSFWYDRGVAFSWLGSAPTPTDGSRVFLTVGALESDVMVPPMRRMATALKDRFPHLEIHSTIYPEEYHGSVVAGSISAAFRVLYRRPTVAIAPSDARALVGRWVAPGGAASRSSPKQAA